MMQETLMPDSSLMLTTIDNPFNPKENYEGWRQWDEDNGYFTEQFIARLVTSEENHDIDDDAIQEQIFNKVINEIIEHDVLKIYTLI